MQKNTELREAAKKSGVKLWEIAQELGIDNCNFSKKLRNEFAQKDKDHVLDLIEKLKIEKESEI